MRYCNYFLRLRYLFVEFVYYYFAYPFFNALSTQPAVGAGNSALAAILGLIYIWYLIEPYLFIWSLALLWPLVFGHFTYGIYVNST